MANQIDLKNIFQIVTENLSENKESLNQSDSYNHNHGDNMVEIFNIITKAMDAKKSAEPADQLAFASEQLKKKASSGTSSLYVDGLSNAAQQFQGQNITSDNAMQLVQLLLGAAKTTGGGAEDESGTLGSLFSGLTGKDLPDSLAGLDTGDLLAAGMSFMQSKQSGSSNVEALIRAVISTSQMGESPHRAQSGEIVAKTLMQVIGSMGAK